MAERITIPALERLVLRLPAPEPFIATIPAPAELVATIPAPIDAVLTLPAPQADRLVLPESLMPRVPGIAAGGVTADVSITGTAVARARAVGTITAEASMSATAKARAVAAGAITAAASITGIARPYAAGAVTAAVAITGKAVAKLAGAVTAAASITGTAKPVLAGGVTAAATVSGTAMARATAAGAVTVEASITGTATQPKFPAGMDKSGTQLITRAVWEDVTGFVVRSGYPETVMSASKLVAGAQMTVTFTARLGFSSTASSQSIRIVKNGTEVVATGNPGSALTGTVTFTSNTDTLSLQAYSDNSLTGTRTVLSGATNTYLYWTVVS
ncbi:hypothetical protein 7S2_47 [uncultured Caudovirales phage]|uniref:Uncharacterized protein n=1 Tax=uncultured Caudovirales phage TaxID=2100421 RepID=A0A2H4J9X1_9CAUD|nr:hypothetical protein 7S2_47 [uncultured Caudovirales phage]